MTRFRLNCLFRILFLAGSIYLFITLIDNPHYRVTTVALGFLIAYLVFNLIYFVESTNRHFGQFLMSIRQSDFSHTPIAGNFGSSFDELKTAYNEVLKVFRESRAESEEKARYLQMVVQHVRVGLIGFNQDGVIEIQNNAARKLLHCNQLRHIDDLGAINEELINAIRNPDLAPNTIVKIDSGGDYLQLVINISRLQFRNTLHTLVSLYDIQSELEEKEMEAWQNLIRVLTHEIMNSITPISSLAQTAHTIIKEEIEISDVPDSKYLNQVATAVETINKRSQNLLTFVENYRKLTRIPNLDFQHIVLPELFQRIHDLMQPQLTSSAVELVCDTDPTDLKLTCDPNLLEQVLINLIGNAIQATHEKKGARIDLKAGVSQVGRAVISIKDNGCGIEKDVIDKVFIPFFTTKKEGSGIGLSFSRQIMRLHGGSIKVHSIAGEGTTFILNF
jgi:two-component system, NtrC family, nitrogen regulation sensor histidine kinase NtrY